jgi:molybdate transport system substrate-binding protein
MAVCWALGCSSKPSPKTVRVAAAADLSRSFEELGKAFTSRTGITPIFTFGSSGMLAKQIEQGAPFFLFASASREYAEVPIAADRCDRSSVATYARGRLAVWTPPGIPGPKTFAELADVRFTRISIANPDHAPYGKAAQQALEKAGIYAAVKDRLVLGDNVQAAFEFAKSKNADATIIALSLVVDKGSFLAVDSALYEPLDQVLVVCGSGDEAERGHELADFIASPDGREIMTRYGFSLGTEVPVARP